MDTKTQLQIENTAVLSNVLQLGVNVLRRAAATSLTDTVDGVKYTDASLGKLIGDHLLIELRSNKK